MRLKSFKISLRKFFLFRYHKSYLSFGETDSNTIQYALGTGLTNITFQSETKSKKLAM